MWVLYVMRYMAGICNLAHKYKINVICIYVWVREKGKWRDTEKCVSVEPVAILQEGNKCKLRNW